MMATWGRPRTARVMCWLQRLTEYQHGGFVSAGDRLRSQRICWLHGRPKTTRVLLLLQVLAEDDENGFWDHCGRLKTKTVMLKL